MTEGGDEAQLAERKWMKGEADASYIAIYPPKVAMISLAENNYPAVVVIESDALSNSAKGSRHSAGDVRYLVGGSLILRSIHHSQAHTMISLAENNYPVVVVIESDALFNSAEGSRHSAGDVDSLWAVLLNFTLKNLLPNKHTPLRFLY